MSTEYEVRKAIEAAEAKLRKQGLILPDEASISAYAKSNNMTEAEAMENIEKEFDAIESSVGYNEKIEGINWTGEATASPSSSNSQFEPTLEGDADHAPHPDPAPIQTPSAKEKFKETEDSSSGAEGITGQYGEQLHGEFIDWENKNISPFDGIAPNVTGSLQRARYIEKGKNNGICEESVPRYNMEISEGIYTSEQILNGAKEARTSNNAWVIVGRDRPAGPETGYGGKGHTRSAAIDIVVGMQGHGPNNEMTVDKNFGSMTTGMPGDAARIYISQRADIDNYFGICDGYVGNSKTDSAIGMKADSVRIMANKGIKIVTGGAPQQKTSLYGATSVTYGIDLIAGNRDTATAKAKGDGPTKSSQPYLQPIPKGLNLEDFLEEIVDSLVTLNVLLTEFANRQVSINSLLSTGPWLGGGILGPGALNPASIAFVQSYSTIIGTAVIPQLGLQRKHLNGLETNYLSAGGPYYINSRYNRTN